MPQRAAAAADPAVAAAGEPKPTAAAAAEAAADTEDLLQLAVPFCVEVAVPLVASSWPPQLHFGTVRESADSFFFHLT